MANNVPSTNLPPIAGSTGNNAELRSGASVPKEYLWTLNAEQVRKWLGGISALFPARPKLRVDTAGNILIKDGT
jgi:hypothetical protein